MAKWIEREGGKKDERREAVEQDIKDRIFTTQEPLNASDMSSWFESLSSSFSSFAKSAVDTAAGVHAVTSRSYVSQVSCGLELVDPSKDKDMALIKDLARAAELSRQVYNYIDMTMHEDCTLIRPESPVIVGFYERSEDTVWICCRGTHTPDCLVFDFSWLQDVDYLKDTNIKVPKKIADVIDEEIHSILSYIHDVTGKNGVKLSKLRFTGHSLGGAVMTALFLSLKSGVFFNELDDIGTAVYTFGAPSVCLEERPSLPGDHVHHVCYQLDLVPRLVGPHDIPPKLVSADFVKSLLHYSERGAVSRKGYLHFGNYYALHGGSKPLLEKAKNPQLFLSALPTEPLLIPLAINDHSCSNGYCRVLGEIAIQCGLSDPSPIIRGDSESNFRAGKFQQRRSSTSSVDSVD